MSSSKSEAVQLTKEAKEWVLQHQHDQKALSIFRYKKLPKKLPMGFRFLAWTVGMPPKASRIERRCRLRPEDTKFDGPLWYYTASDRRYTWVTKSPSEDSEARDGGEEEDGGDDDDEDVAPRQWIGWHGYGDLSGYSCDEDGNWYDTEGRQMPVCSELPDEIQYSPPFRAWNVSPWPLQKAPALAMSRRFMPMGISDRKDVDNSFVKVDERTGLPIRHTQRPTVKSYEALNKCGVEQFRV
ncbi:hypothetical protein NQ176_g5806 [Zarea fungicola]|uniref:Uncharacterized protein n=1 Tax=Zarea fungicola TaxID=93591 RepID=A0ACC1N7Z8_9HYPO|nr:hypothetical protein NQ176_g5806 [Lecanicillium fungicola]